MSPSDGSLFLACAFIAEVIGTTAGFGAATILTPVAVLFMDMKTAIAMVAVFHLFGSASRLYFFGRQIDWQIWRWFGLTAILCSFFGARLTLELSSAAIQLAFGIFLLVYVAISLALGERLRLPVAKGVLAAGGVGSGFITGLIGTGGAIRSACLLAFGLRKEIYIGTSAAIALIVDATRIPVYVTGGYLHASSLPWLTGLVVVAFAGAWVGKKIVKRVSQATFHRFVMVLLALMGLKMLLDGWRGVG